MPLSGQDSTRHRSRPYDWDESDLQPRMPPGATGSRPPRASGSTSHASSHANSYSRATLDTLLNAPTRESQPHLHPFKINGALWFGIDPSVHKFIRTTWQRYFMGPWKNWTEVPDERKENWWFTFIQNYYWENGFMRRSTTTGSNRQ